jgi:ABC-type polysaccharide/polyol phosphate transport system ATPase subunit
LRGVDLEVERGSCVGVIGRNGSGKTTLLRMLAGVTAPTEGTVSVRGKVAPLIAVGVGFHPELTGRENVYLGGTILGLTRAQLDARFDEIVEFAEIRDFIDTPVKFYSSGMYVRLGFSMSVLSDPEILLVDEVLAVGDLAFQMKCFDRMQEIRSAGTTIVVVSHNLNAIRRLCDRSAVIHDSALVFDGDTAEAISRFHELLGEERDLDGLGSTGRELFEGTGRARFETFDLQDAAGASTRHIESGAEVRFVADLAIARQVEGASLTFRVFHESGVHLYGETVPLGESVHLAEGSAHQVTVQMPLHLPRGSYSADVVLASPDGSVHAPPPPTLLFYVNGRRGVSGLADLRARFDVTP